MCSARLHAFLKPTCAGDFLDYPVNMRWSELIAFWLTFALTFLSFISWFNLDERSEKPQNAAKLIRRWRGHRKK
jgi:hypothetical protein